MSVKKKICWLQFPKVTSSNCFFCPTNSPKLKDSSLTVNIDQEQQQILTFKKLEPPKNVHFCLKDDWIDQLMDWSLQPTTYLKVSTECSRLIHQSFRPFIRYLTRISQSNVFERLLLSETPKLFIYCHKRWRRAANYHV